MPTATTDSLYNTTESMKKNINGLADRLDKLENISKIFITTATLKTSMASIEAITDELKDTVSRLENKLQKINLPSDTRYYLDESEITDFRNHFRQLRSMMAELEKSRQAFIRLSSRYNLTNSTL